MRVHTLPWMRAQTLNSSVVVLIDGTQHRGNLAVARLYNTCTNHDRALLMPVV
jgi:hypothetical protein